MSKSVVRSIKNVTNGYSLVQKLVRNATLNDPLGPTTFEMEELAQLTHQSQTDFLEIMDMLDRRLNDKGKNWRHVAKSLTVLDYLVRFGSEKCVLWAKDNLYIVKTLREFIHFDEADHDQGALIRVKAKELVSFLRDDERLRHERELAQRQQTGTPPILIWGRQVARWATSHMTKTCNGHLSFCASPPRMNNAGLPPPLPPLTTTRISKRPSNS